MPPDVHVWADPVCPFCYVATERADWLEARFGARITWHPFDLHPEYPPEGIPLEQLLARYGPELHARVDRMIDEAGLPRAQRPPRVPNTERAQRVALSAGEHFGDVHRRMTEAYWGRGRDIGDAAVVTEEAVAAGLDAGAVAEVLATDAHRAELTAETNRVYEAGATGVPAWVVDERVLVPGAQPHEVFEQVLGRLGHTAAA